MNAESGNGAQWAQQNDPRVTRVGRSLRKYRLDEFPQLINVIRGDMSFVGPRPERPAFVEMLRKEIPYYDERHSVRPGITGWAQVRYDYGATVEDALRKLEYELFYLQNMSVLFDLAIMFATCPRHVVGQRSPIAHSPVRAASLTRSFHGRFVSRAVRLRRSRAVPTELGGRCRGRRRILWESERNVAGPAACSETKFPSRPARC